MRATPFGLTFAYLHRAGTDRGCSSPEVVSVDRPAFLEELGDCSAFAQQPLTIGPKPVADSVQLNHGARGTGIEDERCS